MDIRMPRIDGKTDKEQLVQIRSYLYQFAQQLQWALNTVESGNGSNIVLQKNSGGGGAQKVTVPQDFNELKALIIKSADIVKAFYTQITELFKGTSTYEAISDFGTFKEEINNALYGDNKGLFQQVSDIQQILDEDGNVKLERLVNGQIYSGIIEYAKDGDAIVGIEIGQTTKRTDGSNESVFEAFARFTASELAFYDAQVKVAYISRSRLYITNATVTGDLELGSFLLDTTYGLTLLPIDNAEEPTENGRIENR